jgi:hypothetical protein
MIAIRGHFFGKLFVPDEPVDLPQHTSVIVHIEPADEADVEGAWVDAICREWSAELSDPREDIYTLQDAESINVPR